MLRKIAKKSQIPEGKALCVDLGGLTLALFNIEGKIYALDSLCPHEGGPLCEGTIEGKTVTCPWHSWTFDISSGECVNIPGESADRYSIIIEGEDVFIEEK